MLNFKWIIISLSTAICSFTLCVCTHIRLKIGKTGNIFFVHYLFFFFCIIIRYLNWLVDQIVDAHFVFTVTILFGLLLSVNLSIVSSTSLSLIEPFNNGTCIFRFLQHFDNKPKMRFHIFTNSSISKFVRWMFIM